MKAIMYVQQDDSINIDNSCLFLSGGTQCRDEEIRERERYLLFSAPALDKSPFSSAYLSGRKRESDANKFFGAVSKLFNLCAKYVY